MFTQPSVLWCHVGTPSCPRGAVWSVLNAGTTSPGPHVHPRDLRGRLQVPEGSGTNGRVCCARMCITCAETRRQGGVLPTLQKLLCRVHRVPRRPLMTTCTSLLKVSVVRSPVPDCRVLCKTQACHPVSTYPAPVGGAVAHSHRLAWWLLVDAAGVDRHGNIQAGQFGCNCAPLAHDTPAPSFCRYTQRACE